MGTGKTAEIEIECPFCHKVKIKVMHKEGYYQAKTSRISAGAKTKYYWISDSYDVLENCPHCGARKKDIQDYYEVKYKEKLSHEERLERWKKRGLPLVLGK